MRQPLINGQYADSVVIVDITGNLIQNTTADNQQTQITIQGIQRDTLYEIRDALNQQSPSISVLPLADNITAVSTSGAINLLSVYSTFTFQLSIISGSLTALTCVIQGSVNGTKWFDLGTISSIIDGSVIQVVDKPVVYLRAKTTSVTGTSPNVSILACGNK